MSEEAPVLRISERMADLLSAAINTYGEPVVCWAWESFMPALLPFADAKIKEARLTAEASALGLNEDQIVDAMSLYAALSKSSDPHHAWKAAEVMLRIAPDGAGNLLAAMGPPANKVGV